LRLSVILSLLFLTITCQASNLTWYIYHKPPIYFTTGEKKGEGIYDQIIEKISKNLPQYHVDIKQASISRLINDYKLGENVCFLAATKTAENKQYIEFSQSSVMQLNVHIVIKQKLADKLGLANEIILDDLFGKYNLSMVKIAGRPYMEIDNLLACYPSQVSDRSSVSITGMFEMLRNDRIDFLISDINVANYALGDNAEHYKYITIKGLKNLELGYIGCSKTPWGENAIQDINNVLSKIKSQPEYLNILSSQYSKDVLNNDYYNFYHEQFLKDI